MFNLITDAWVPVTYRDGHRALVGLRQLMVDAEAINPQLDIPDASAARAIERLLIAVVYQATKPTMWAALWHKAWPAQEIITYLDRWRDRFDLDRFGQYQITSAAKAPYSGLDRLLLEGSSTSRTPSALPAAEAARGLLGRLLWDPSGIRTGLAGDPMSNGGRSMPIGPAYLAMVPTVVVHLDTLAHTLVWNLPEGAESPSRVDTPLWEDDPAAPRRSWLASEVGPGRVLVWPGRRIKLHHDGDVGDGVLLANGDPLRPEGRLHEVEPHGLWRQPVVRTPKTGKVKTTRRRTGKPTPVRQNKVSWRTPGQLEPLWGAALDLGGPRPIGIHRLLNPPITDAPSQARLITVAALLGTHSSTLDDIIHRDLLVTTRGLPDRIHAIGLLNGFLIRMTDLQVEARIYGMAQPDPKQITKIREEITTQEQHDAVVEETLTSHLAGHELDLTPLHHHVMAAASEMEDIIHRQKIRHTLTSTTTRGTSGNALPNTLYKTWRTLQDRLSDLAILPTERNCQSRQKQ